MSKVEEIVVDNLEEFAKKSKMNNIHYKESLYGK